MKTAYDKWNSGISLKDTEVIQLLTDLAKMASAARSLGVCYSCVEIAAVHTWYAVSTVADARKLSYPGLQVG